MDAKIDYLSFTLMVDPRGAGGAAAQEGAVSNALRAHAPTFFSEFAMRYNWQVGGARGHYGTSFFQPEMFVAVRFGGTANHILVEMPGTACQAARDRGALLALLAEVADRLTRLDIAVDIPNGCSPSEFVRAGYNERFKSHAEIISEAGETQYVGSMKSERFSRVYRYNAPHPRAGTLRVEFVLRSEYAKSAATILSGGDVPSLAATLGNTFGWLSPHWQPDILTNAKLRASRADRHEPGRVRWLHQVVVPALVKAHKQGLVSVDDIFARVQQLIEA